MFHDWGRHFILRKGDLTASACMNCVFGVQSVQLQNLGHLFDDLDKAGSDVSECPDTPLHLFPNTPTSDLLLHGHFNHFFPEAQTPPQVLLSPNRFLAKRNFLLGE